MTKTQPEVPQPSIPVRAFFTLDIRSLALFRVALAFMILLDWLDRLPDLRILYSDDGIVPRNILTGIQPVSIHLLHGSLWFQALLAGIAIVFALALLIGWRTSFATLVSWFLLISVHARNPALMQGGDHLLRMITFWSIFLPLGAAWSLDSSRRGGQPRFRGVCSTASVAYLLQICMVYWFASAWKWMGPWREEGTAVYLALHVDHFPTRVGLLVREFPDLCWFLTHGTIWLETLGPVLLLLPFDVAFQRLVAITLFILFHAGLALTMELAHFPFVCMVAWLPLLPGLFWDRLESRLRPPDVERLLLAFEPERPRAGTLLAWLRVFLCLRDARLEVFDPGTSLGTRLRQQGGWAVVDPQGTEHHGVEALERLFTLSPLGGPGVRLLRTRFGRWLGARIVGYVSKPRHATRPATEVISPPAWAPPSGLVVNSFLVFCLAYVLLCNSFTLAAEKIKVFHPDLAQRVLPLLPAQVTQFGSVLALEQGWGLFAPEPGRFVGWFVVAGTQKDGTQIDVLTGEPLSWEKPAYLTTTYPNGRWRKFMMNLAAFDAYPFLLPGFSRYYFREWNRTHEGARQLDAVEIYWMKEVTMPPGVQPPPVERLFLGRYTQPLPRPDRLEGWLVVAGTRQDGKRIDLLRGEAPLSLARPDPLLGPRAIASWQPFLAALVASDAWERLLPGYARYLLEDYNAKHGPAERLRSLVILRLRDDPKATRADAPPLEQVLARYPAEEAGR